MKVCLLAKLAYCFVCKIPDLSLADNLEGVGVFFVSLSLLKLVLTSASASAAPPKMKLCGNFTKMRLAFSQRLITCPQNKSFELLKGEKRQQ